MKDKNKQKLEEIISKLHQLEIEFDTLTKQQIKGALFLNSKRLIDLSFKIK